MTEPATQVRGRLWGTHCLGCGMPFSDDDVPVHRGPMARVAATGWTLNCASCREWSAVRAENRAHAEAQMGRAWRIMRNETFSALRIPNIVAWLSRRLSPRR